VELVSFQGPHFGDRYGIASRVVDALQSARIELLAMSCASASIHLVVGEGQGQAAVDHLRGPFGGPRGREAPPGEADTP
jgi:aspartokinase